MTRDYASFEPVPSNILDHSVYDHEAGSSLIVYTKLEGAASQNDGHMDGRTDGQTNRQTDRQTDRQMHCWHLRMLAYSFVV